ncbi:hypothetical protein DRH14_04810 [Candidatus Shapirobacteria bacterium]|nr:MAG: hypothetical protein DRH14_04810 [Candidatus Shapirobacteria bacterium]
MNKKIKLISTILGLFLFLGALSYWSFDRFLPQTRAKVENKQLNASQNKTEEEKQQQVGILEFEGPKEEKCPINGELFTKEEKNIWKKRRPLMVMIENHKDARPQSGLSKADVVYEVIAEGGITRFMAVYYCNAVSGVKKKYDVGPVRSARTYFLDLASEYSDYPLYAHVGGANCSAPKDPNTGRQAGPCTTKKQAQAIEQITSYGWNNKGSWSDLSQFSLSYKVCRREKERTGEIKDTEHTMYCSTNELWNIAEKRGLTNLTKMNKKSWDKSFYEWSFGKSENNESLDKVKQITIPFWGDEDYQVSWEYDAEKDAYLRFNGGKKSIDFNNGKQLEAKNVLIQFTKERRSIDEHKHNLYQMIGRGKAVLLQNGVKKEIVWSKKSRKARTIFKDSNGREVEFVPGKIWIEVVAIGAKIEYASQ